ncbi:MAG TPA: type II toxin-antitoxin system Phd/YefM family antitoxin, partial [Chloroflexota bacterium]
ALPRHSRRYDTLIDADLTMGLYMHLGRKLTMASRLPQIRPITDLARDARALIERARQDQAPIVITQRGRDAAVLVPIELYRWMEGIVAHRMSSPRLVRPEDAARFQVEMTMLESTEQEPRADL